MSIQEEPYTNTVDPGRGFAGHLGLAASVGRGSRSFRQRRACVNNGRMTPKTHVAAARRVRLAKAEGRELIRRMRNVDQLDSDQTVALADAFMGLFMKYPDVYPKPPISVDALYAHAQELKEAEEAVRREEAEAKAATRRLEAAREALARGLQKPGT